MNKLLVFNSSFLVCASKTFFACRLSLSAFLRLSMHEAAYRDTGVDVKLILDDSYAQPVIERSISLYPEDNG